VATRLFTLDRQSYYSSGMQFCLKPPDYKSLGPIVLEHSFLQGLFSEGISTHGQRYLINRTVIAGNLPNNEAITYANSTVEIIFELVRRLEFPALTSRFQVMFACQSESDLRRFAAQTGSHGTIYAVEAYQFQVCDMALLTLGNTISHAWRNARQYWSGALSANPLLECLIKLPATLDEQLGKI
jgi:hypothetical protein